MSNGKTNCIPELITLGDKAMKAGLSVYAYGVGSVLMGMYGYAYSRNDPPLSLYVTLDHFRVLYDQGVERGLEEYCQGVGSALCVVLGCYGLGDMESRINGQIIPYVEPEKLSHSYAGGM